jgi:ribonuclease J
VPETVVAPNGTLVRLAPGPATVIDHVQAGRLARDGDLLVPIDGPSLRERRNLLWEGAAAVSLVLDARGKALAAPKVSLRGFDDPDGALVGDAARAAQEALDDLSASERLDDDRVHEAVRLAVRRVVRAHTGKKPLTDAHIVRI